MSDHPTPTTAVNVNLPEVDGRSLWEVVVRMDTKLDVALNKIDDHEQRLRNTASVDELKAVTAKVATIDTKVTDLASNAVTTKGLMTSLAGTVTLILGLTALIEKLIR